MTDLRLHTYNNKVWVPLYAEHRISETGEIGHEGFREEYFGAHSIIVHQEQRVLALTLEGMDVSNISNHKPWVDDDNEFHSASEYEWHDVNGTYPVLSQYFEVERRTEAHINQDLTLALGLKRDGDSWVCPEEDYVEVIKLARNEDGKPIKIEIKAEFLKDYLCATNSGLLLLTYHSRQAISQSFVDLSWQEDEEVDERNDRYRFSGRLIPIHEGHFPFNQSIHVLHAGRTDTDFYEDIPVYEFPTDETSYSQSYVIEPKGRKLHHAIGEIWKKEWVSPAAKSPRVRGDRVPSTLEFVVDNEGNRETSDSLIGPSRWLWFDPNVVNDLLKKQTGMLVWYTSDTGSVGGAWNRAVHFGVNAIGLINVYAKDIGQMAEIDKRTWARHNVSPEAGVSSELLMSQMQAMPADTQAPEQLMFSLIDELDSICKSKFGRPLFKPHPFQKDISKKIHRFQAINLEGFYSLAKEITRFVIERIDVDFLKQLRVETEKLGSLKRLQNILTALGYDGRSMLAVLAGIYELRIADAHLPSTDNIRDSMKLVGVEYEELKLNSGKKLIENVNRSLIQVKTAFENGDFRKVS